MQIDDTFEHHIDPRWHVGEIGSGTVVRRHGALWLTVLPCEQQYSDAQISDYDPAERAFHYQPPLRLTVTAHTNLPAGQLNGTAGFGFWNHAFVPAERGFHLPQAIWFFFGSPPNNMALAKGIAGHGWKAATFDAKRWQFLALLPFAPVGIPLMHIPPLYNALWPVGQRSLGVSETALDTNLLTMPHTYTLDWLPERAIFSVDGDVVHTAERVPQTPLGFIAWMDNQYAIVTPKGRFGFGTLDVPREQSLVLRQVTIEPL